MNGTSHVLRESSSVIARRGEAPTRQSHVIPPKHDLVSIAVRLLRSFHSLAMTSLPYTFRSQARHCEEGRSSDEAGKRSFHLPWPRLEARPNRLPRSFHSLAMTSFPFIFRSQASHCETGCSPDAADKRSFHLPAPWLGGRSGQIASIMPLPRNDGFFIDL